MRIFLFISTFLFVQLSLAQDRPWRPPQFATQEMSLGYGENVFAVPVGMEKQVDFWLKIYSQYGLHQGVIHEANNIDMIFDVVDFNPIESDTTLTDRQKAKARRQLVEDAKFKATETLKKLDTLTSAEGLNDYEKKIWDYYQNVSDLDKFKEAQKNIRYQLGQKDRMEKAIYLSGRYLEDMESLFKEQGLPIELTRLVFVESSFNVLARSKVGASGLWQIMRYTGRRKLTMNGIVDNRNDPMEATRTAAFLLRANYNMLQSWPLAVTGYNHGPVGVRAISTKYKTTQLPELIKNVTTRKSFGFASRNFYACFLAALEVERNALKYFPTAKWSMPLDRQPLKLSQSIKYSQLLKWFEDDNLKLQIHNPHIMPHAHRYSLVLPHGTQVYIPTDKLDVALSEVKQNKVKEIAMVDTPISDKTYVVAPGDTLYGIARSFGIKLKDLLVVNELDSPEKLRTGQKIRIP